MKRIFYDATRTFCTLYMTRDLVRELEKRHHEAVAILVTREVELANTRYILVPKQKMEKAFVSNNTGFNGVFYECVKDGIFTTD